MNGGTPPTGIPAGLTAGTPLPAAPVTVLGLGTEPVGNAAAFNWLILGVWDGNPAGVNILVVAAFLPGNGSGLN